MSECRECKSEYDEYGQKVRLCKPCRREYNRIYHKNRSAESKANKQKNQKIRKARILNEVREYKSAHGCKHCDEKESVCLEFHHTNSDEKEYNISDAIAKGLSIKSLMVEIEKCIVVCSNCHKKIHAGII